MADAIIGYSTVKETALHAVMIIEGENEADLSGDEEGGAKQD
jgi:hypothetical protein